MVGRKSPPIMAARPYPLPTELLFVSRLLRSVGRVRTSVLVSRMASGGRLGSWYIREKLSAMARSAWLRAMARSTSASRSAPWSLGFLLRTYFSVSSRLNSRTWNMRRTFSSIPAISSVRARIFSVAIWILIRLVLSGLAWASAMIFW